jgi:lipoprotein signal peptidase
LDKRRSWLRTSLVFIVAGGIGNFIDRTLYLMDPTMLAGVRDMVRLKIWFMDFGVCNFADFFIVGGAIALMLAIVFFDAWAIYPLTDKYKALVKEYEEKEEAKKREKAGK